MNIIISGNSQLYIFLRFKNGSRIERILKLVPCSLAMHALTLILIYKQYVLYVEAYKT